MQKQKYGRVINVASLAGFAPPTAGHTLYGATKSFLIKFSHSLHLEGKDHDVHVTALCPGFTYTEFHDVNGTRNMSPVATKQKNNLKLRELPMDKDLLLVWRPLSLQVPQTLMVCCAKPLTRSYLWHNGKNECLAGWSSLLLSLTEGREEPTCGHCL